MSELKSLTDAKGDIHSLHKLVYRDIKDVATREEVRMIAGAFLLRAMIP